MDTGLRTTSPALPSQKGVEQMTIDAERYLLEQDRAEILAVIREGLQDTIAVVPACMRFRYSDRVCETWVMQTELCTVEIVFYFNGQVVLNTAPYDPDVLTWITAKAHLIKMTGHLQ